MNTVLGWPDRVLVISQGDDATRWYYYRYELTAQVVNGFGGFYGRLGETQDRWDSDFMNAAVPFKLAAVAESGVE